MVELDVGLHMKVGMIPEGSPHVIEKDIVGVNKAPASCHIPHTSVIRVAIAQDMLTVCMKSGHHHGIVEESQHELILRLQVECCSNQI